MADLGDFERVIELGPDLLSAYAWEDLTGDSDRLSDEVWEWLIGVQEIEKDIAGVALWEATSAGAGRRQRFASQLRTQLESAPERLQNPKLIADLEEILEIVDSTDRIE